MADDSPWSVEAAQYRAPRDGGRHAVFAPLHYERGYAYPLIVWLHGPDDDERQLKRIMPLISMRNYVAVAPRGTVPSTTRTGHEAFAWCQTEEHIALAEHYVTQCVRSVRAEFNIAPARIFLAGYECGGTMALRLGLCHPQLFAGVLSLGGPFPEGFMPLGRLVEVRRLRWFLATGRDSQQYCPDKVCENLRLMYAAGLTVNLRQYPCGDELTTQMLADMDRWIMEQVVSGTTVASGSIGQQTGRS